MKKKLFSKGFTLIELLVVIAIIGILASVVLASLSTARTQGGDSAIKSNLAGIHAQAELFHDDPNRGNETYGVAFPVGDCATSTVGSIFEESVIASQYVAAQDASKNTASCVSSDSAWAVSVPLKTVPTDSWCVDSSGGARQVTPALGDRGFAGVECKP